MRRHPPGGCRTRKGRIYVYLLLYTRTTRRKEADQTRAFLDDDEPPSVGGFESSNYITIALNRVAQIEVHLFALLQVLLTTVATSIRQ